MAERPSRSSRAAPDPAADGDDGRPEPKGNQRAVIESRAACTSVDAGAGTGKTTTMLMRIEHAIEHDGVAPEDVLVLTFANEAAASIREAVAERLEPDVAAEIDVYTYHSFCYRLVREYAYYLGLSPSVDVITEGGRRRLVGRLLAEREYEFADEAARGEGTTTELADSIDRFIAGMSREDIDPETLQQGLPDVRTLEFLGELVLWLTREADRELSFENEALRYFNREEHLEAARESLIGYGKLLTYCREKIAEAPAAVRDDDVVRDVERYLRTLQECVTNTIETLSLEEPTTKQLPRTLFGNEIGRDATSRIEQTPIGRLEHSLTFLRQARHYADVYADYRAALEAEGILDFDELVRTATRLLRAESADGTASESVAAGIAEQWTQVYCDEFQDTDETQFSLIAELTAGEDRPELVAIGDKDQAIYGWRGTDREGLDRLARVYDDHEAIELGLNFRSRQEILDVTNRCDYGLQSSKTLREHGRVPGEYDERRPPSRVATVESDELESSTAEQVGTTVSRLLNGEFENVPRRELGDIAVIVRTNRHARAVADELESLQIPHEISGSPRGEISPGIQTLVSYLHAIASPPAERHLRRVLLYRYRLPDADLDRLHAAEGSLRDALEVVDPDDADAPGRLRQARDHLDELERLRDVLPRAQFVRRFRELTRLEWFLTGEERAALDRLDRFVDAYDDGSVLGSLTTEFVDALERSIRGDVGADRGARSTDRVDVMTVHQAKGLQFDTVLVPYLSDEEWCVERDYAARARYRLLSATLDDAVESPLLADLAAETVGEEWRVLHVALTRAENHLFLFGSSYDYDGGPDELAASTAEACLSPAIEWSVTGERMDLWETLTDGVDRVRETYPETVVDLTDRLAVSAETTPGTIAYYAGYGDRPIEPLETREAVDAVHRLGRLLRRGRLLPAADAADALSGDGTEFALPATRHTSALTAETTRFPVKSLSSATAVPVALRHSYTAMRTYESCPRKHYLDHVVRAVDDPVPGGDAGARIVGTVFHDVAEEAFYRDYRTPSAWRAAARRHLTARNLLEHRGAVVACIDRYFEARAPGFDEPVAAWTPLAAEYRFALEDVPDVSGRVVGAVDSIRRMPDGGLAVLDYKATAERVEPDDATQLRLYRRACERRFDEPIEAVGYVYVGEGPGPAAELYSPEELPPWSSVRATLEAVDAPSYEETTPGDHCRYCPHRSLGCAPEGLDAPNASEVTEDARNAE